MTGAERAREYYRALDEHDYDALERVLAPEFVHERPDMTLSGRERFVRFMREERPQRETTHRVDAVYGGDGDELPVRGRLLDAGGECLVEFVDVFRFDGAAIAGIDTYTR